MGCYYYLYSSKKTKTMVRDEDFDAIDKYIQSPEEVNGPFDDAPYADLETQKVNDEYKWIDGAYQIASRAVQLGKENVIKHIADKIFFDCIRDGNTYNLFVLATEKQQFHLIDLLWEIACEYGHCPIAKEQLSYATVRLLGYCDLQETDVIKYLPLYIKNGINLLDLYSCSISWQKPIVQKWLEDNCGTDRINQKFLECTHTLELSNFDKGHYQYGNWTCNMCDNSFQKGTERWFCKFCNNDVCCDCYNNK